MASRMRRAPVSTDKRFKRNSMGSDYGTLERWQHSGRALEKTDRPGVLAARATEEHILDILGLKKQLSETQIEAGLKFKADYHAAAIAAHVTGSYSGMRVPSDVYRLEHERTSSEEAAYARWRMAVKELGLACGATVIEVVCNDAPPLPCDVRVLREGLEKLARWYRLPFQKPLQAGAKK